MTIINLERRNSWARTIYDDEAAEKRRPAPVRRFVAAEIRITGWTTQVAACVRVVVTSSSPAAELIPSSRRVVDWPTTVVRPSQTDSEA